MHAHLFLVAYDISCPRRWRRAQKMFKGIGRRGQLSVFVCRGTQPRILRLEQELRSVLDYRDDRLMILDLGPAHAALPKIVNINPVTDIVELEAAVL